MRSVTLVTLASSADPTVWVGRGSRQSAVGVGVGMGGKVGGALWGLRRRRLGAEARMGPLGVVRGDECGVGSGWEVLDGAMVPTRMRLRRGTLSRAGSVGTGGTL